MCNKCLFLSVLLSVIYSNLAVSVPFITKCQPTDSKCYKSNTVNAIPLFAAGIPELGVEQLDPLYISEIDASTPNLKFLINDAKIVGLKDCQPLKIENDKSNSKLYLSLECTTDLYGKYVMDGQVLFLQLQGNGNAHFKLRNIQVNVICNHIEKVGKDGKLHYAIKNTDYTFDLKGKAEIELENLLPGNEVLARAAKELFDTNANDVVDDVGPPIIKIVVDRIVRSINNFLHAAAIEEIEIV